MIGQALETMLFGMAGVFIVMAVIIGVVRLLGQTDKKSEDSQGK